MVGRPSLCCLVTALALIGAIAFPAGASPIGVRSIAHPEGIMVDSMALARPDDGVQIADLARQKGLPAAVGGSCFVGQIEGDLGLNAMASTVLVVVRDGQGRVRHSGSGVIVADSAGSDGLNRILTAAHVVAPLDGASGIEVYASWGALLGRARVEVAPDLRPGRPGSSFVGMTELFVSNLLPSVDVAVLAISQASEDYGRLPGMRLARRQAPYALDLSQITPFSLTGGASGSPVIDEDGQIIGIVSTSRDRTEKGTVWHDAPMIFEMGDLPALALRFKAEDGIIAGNPDDGRAVFRYPVRGNVLAASVTQDDALIALDKADGDVVVDDASSRMTYVLGYPKGGCVVLHGWMNMYRSIRSGHDFVTVSLEARPVDAR